MSKFYVLSVVNDSPHQEKVEHWFSNDPKQLREIYEKEKSWMSKRQTDMFCVEAGKKGKTNIWKLRKVHNTDLSDVHICQNCYIFYLSKQMCTECNKETVEPD